MSFSIRPPDGGPIGIGSGPPPAPPKPEPARTEGPTFARVYALEEARRRREVPLPPIAGDRIPSEVWDEVESAAKLVEQLASRGQRVAFDSDRLTGKVVASLISDAPTGQAGAPVRLSDVVDPGSATRATLPPTPFNRTPSTR